MDVGHLSLVAEYIFGAVRKPDTPKQDGRVSQREYHHQISEKYVEESCAEVSKSARAANYITA